jgi:hypothetical protein
MQGSVDRWRFFCTHPWASNQWLQMSTVNTTCDPSFFCIEGSRALLLFCDTIQGLFISASAFRSLVCAKLQANTALRLRAGLRVVDSAPCLPVSVPLLHQNLLHTVLASSRSPSLVSALLSYQYHYLRSAFPLVLLFQLPTTETRLFDRVLDLQGLLNRLVPFRRSVARLYIRVYTQTILQDATFCRLRGPNACGCAYGARPNPERPKPLYGHPTRRRSSNRDRDNCAEYRCCEDYRGGNHTSSNNTDKRAATRDGSRRLSDHSGCNNRGCNHKG